MDKMVSFQLGSQELVVYVDDIPEDATPREIRDMALDIFMEQMHYQIKEG